MAFVDGVAAESSVSKNAPDVATVVAVKDDNATLAFRTRLDRVEAMVARGVTRLTGKPDLTEAWRSLVGTQDIIGLKVYSVPGPYSGTRPAVVEAVIRGLLASGVPATNIVIWDRQSVHLRLAGFYDLAERYGIRVIGAVQAGYDPKVFYENSLLGTPLWGDLEFGTRGDGVGRRSYVSKLLTHEITRLININPVLNHNTAGLCGHLFSLASGGVDNFSRFEPDASRLAIAVPEIYGLAELNDRVVLNITDALICQYAGSERSLLHYSETLNELRFSRDPVALDVLAAEDLERLRKPADLPTLKSNAKLYSNATLLELGVNDRKQIRVERLE